MALRSLCLLGENGQMMKTKSELRFKVKRFIWKKQNILHLFFTLTFNRRSSKCYVRNSAKIMPNFTYEGIFIFLIFFLESFLHNFNQLKTKVLRLILH